MSAAPLLVTIPAPTRVIDYPARDIAAFAIFCRDIVDAVASDELAFIDGVDLAYQNAIESGLVATVGDDVTQCVMAVAFVNARRRP